MKFQIRDESSDSEIDTEETRDEVVIDESGEHILNEHDTPVESENIDDVEEVMVDSTPDVPIPDHSKEITELKEIVKTCKVTLEEKNILLEQKSVHIEDMKKELEEKDWTISAVKIEVNRMKQMIEDGASKDDILDCLDEMQTLLAG